MKKEWEKLFAKEKEKRLAIKALLEQDEPDMEQVESLQTEADKIHVKAVAMKANAAALDAISEPQMPAPLPIDVDPKPENVKASSAAAYVLQFGETDKAVKAILTDLHGVGYEQKRYEQRQGFVKYLRTGRGVSREFLWTPETVKLALKEGQDVKAMKAVMIESSDTLGGHAVPADFRAEVIERMAGVTVVRPRADVITTSRDSVEIPVSTGGGSQFSSAVRVTWVAEKPTAGTAASNATLGMEKIPIHTVMVEIFMSRSSVEDAAFPIVAWLMKKIAEAQAMDEDNKFLKNDGSGSPEGILTGNQTRSSSTIAEVDSGNASALTADGVIDLSYAIDQQYRQGAVMIMAKSSAKAIRKLKTGDGEYIWERNYQAGQPQMILGFPVLEQEVMPVSTTASNYPILFGNLSGYMIADRVGMSIERYLDSATARIDQVLFVARRRLGGQCVEPWKFAVQKVSA